MRAHFIDSAAHVQWRVEHVRYNFDASSGPVHMSFFEGGKTNMCFNCLDRNIVQGRGSQICFIWEGNEPCAFRCRVVLL